MNRIKQPDAGSSNFSTPSVVKNLGGAALLVLAAGFHGRAEATWQSGGDFDSDFSTNLNTETIYGFTGVPGYSNCLKTVDNPSGSGYITKISTDTTCTDFDTNADGTEDEDDAVNSSLVSYDSTLSGDNLNVAGSRVSGDEVMFRNSTEGYAFTVKGLSSGSVTDWTVLDGSPASVGSIDESTGRYLGSESLSGSDYNISEFFDVSDGVSPSILYDTSGVGESSPQADLANDRVFIKQGTSYTITEISDLSGVQTATSTGFTGYPVKFIPAASSAIGFDTIVYLESGSLKYIYDDASAASTTVDADGDGVMSDTDCDDSNASTYPGATETCNSVDDDCDSAIDEAGAVGEVTSYQDSDGDGVGNSSVSVEACDVPAGYVSVGGDCDDEDATKVDDVDCATSSTRDPNCDLALGDTMADEVEVQAGDVICDDAEDMSEGTSELITGSGVYFDGSNIRIAEGFGSEWEFTNADTNFRFAAAGLEIDAEDLVAGMSLGVENLNMNGATPPPSETGDECIPGSVDTTDESKILTMVYDGGTYVLTGDNDLNVTVSGAAWQGLEAQWSDVSSGQEDVVTAEECLEEENPDDTGPGDTDSGDDTAVPIDTAPDDTDSEGDSAVVDTNWQDTGGNTTPPTCGCTYNPSTGAMVPLVVGAGLLLASRRRRQTA